MKVARVFGEMFRLDFSIYVLEKSNNFNFNFQNRSQPQNQNQAKTSPQVRPQSAFISTQTAQSSRKSADNPRRRSDFVSRYESLLNRAQNATKAVDELDLLRLQRAKGSEATQEDLQDNDDDQEEEEVDFNEEEVLQKVNEFQKDYEQRRLVTKPASAPIPKPRQFISGRPLNTTQPQQQEPPAPMPSIRTRSSSLTLSDLKTDESPARPGAKKVEKFEQPSEKSQIYPKPILKKSSDDLRGEFTRPILKRKDSESSLNCPVASGSNLPPTSAPVSGSNPSGSGIGGGILKRKSVTDENMASGSGSTGSNKPEHVRIRSPSPDLDIRPILVRSRNSSVCEEELPQSILKRRAGSQEDLIMDGDISASAGTSGATSRSSPEPPVHGILKRKLSLGNASPDQSIAGVISSILKVILKFSKITIVLILN